MLRPLADGWHLAPEGAAVHPGEAVAVIADVHLGYEWARARGGDVVPARGLAETTVALGRLLGRAPVRRLIVAGDLVEPFVPCVRTGKDLRALRRWLADRGVELEPLRGDHDRRAAWPETVQIAGWTVAHGSRPVAADRTIGGHIHPALKAEGRAFPCVLAGERRLILPAFSADAAGLDVAATRFAGDDADAFRVLAWAGGGWLDFGLLADLRARRMGR